MNTQLLTSDLWSNYCYAEGGDWKPTTRRSKKWWFSTFIEVVGDLPVSELGPVHAYQWTGWLAKHYGKKSQQGARKMIAPLFRYAEDIGACENIFAKIRHVKVPKKEIIVFTDSELQRLLCYASPLMRAVIMLGAGCGLRKGEIRQLMWKDVKWDTDTVVIDSRLEPWPWEPKDHERRRVPMNVQVRSALEAIYDPKTNSPFVVLTPKRYNKLLTQHIQGKEIECTVNWERQWRRLRLQANTDKDFHSLRRTAISRWANAPKIGVLPAMRYAGHADIKTTMDYLLIDDRIQFGIAQPVIGVSRLELLASRPPDERSTKLSYTP